MNRVAAITIHTFKESVREKALYTMIGFALVMMGAAILFGAISVGIHRIILVNLGLTAISVFGLLIAIFIGVSLVSKEIERRTLYNILSKPVRRVEFILGKYLGLLLTLLVNTTMMAAGFYLALFYESQRVGPEALASLEAIYFIVLELAMVVALALLFSAISTPVLSAVFTFSLYAIGNLLSDLHRFGTASRHTIARLVSAALYYLLPNFSDFAVISQAAHGKCAPGYLLVSNSLYALLYVAVLVSATILIFEEREL